MRTLLDLLEHARAALLSRSHLVSPLDSGQMKDTKDVGTSPRHPRLRAVSPVTSKPTRPLFELPLELVHRILELAVDDHPEDICRDKSSTYDPRDHGWREGVTLETLTG